MFRLRNTPHQHPNDGPVDVADDSDAECFARAGIVPVTRLGQGDAIPLVAMANSMLIVVARSVSVPDEARLRMSRAVPSPAAIHSAARRRRGRFRLLDIEIRSGPVRPSVAALSGL